MPSVLEKKSIEGFGIVFLEANYYKLPVIGSYSGGMIESIINGKTGFLIEPNNLSQLIEKIIYLYKNQEVRDKFGEFGKFRVIKEYNWTKIKEKIIMLFEAMNQE